MRAAVAEVWQWLEGVPDPEIPAVSVVDLGIVRDVEWSGTGEDATLNVTITPTYSGCPATRVIERDIERALRERGIEHLRLDVQLAPAWTTDRLTPQAHEKLRAYGIAPPREPAGAMQTGIRAARAPQVACPRCGASDVALISPFGATPCKALYRCNACLAPCDHFKCH